MASWRAGTSKQYRTFLERWQTYCSNRKINYLQPGINDAIEFLVSLYDSGLGYSSLNTARSALSLILNFDGIKFGEHPLVTRFMKGIFELKPSFPKYTEIWDVNIVLEHLKSFGMPEALTLKNLTLKVNMLLCLLTGQRCQTIHKIDTNYIQEYDGGFRISIREKLKQTKAGKHLEPIELLAFKDDKRLCIVEHLREYLRKTSPIRKENSQLLLSFTKPHKPVSKDTIARWNKMILAAAGINTQKYTAHSSRASSTSSCNSKGLNMQEIMKVAGWANAGTFAAFYKKPIESSEKNFGHVLLRDHSL